MKNTIKAITVGQLIEKLKAYDKDRIVMVLLDAKSDLKPITADDWCEYDAGEVFFPNESVENQDEPGLRISII